MTSTHWTSPMRWCRRCGSRLRTVLFLWIPRLPASHPPQTSRLHITSPGPSMAQHLPNLSGSLMLQPQLFTHLPQSWPQTFTHLPQSPTYRSLGPIPPPTCRSLGLKPSPTPYFFNTATISLNSTMQCDASSKIFSPTAHK